MKIQRLDIFDFAEATRVLALQRSAYRVEAELLGRDDIPPLHEEATDLQSCGETFFGGFAGTGLSAVVAYKVVERTLDLHRVMVDPQFFRRGIASALIGFVEALESQTDRTVVATGCRNAPARRLYERLGFVQTGEREVVSGLSVVTFERKRKEQAR